MEIPAPFEAYLYFDAGVFFLITIYSLLRFIISLTIHQPRYASQICFRSLATLNSGSFFILIIVSRFTQNQMSNDAMQVLVIFFSNSMCLSFFYSILEFDSICRDYQFRPYRLNIVFIILILVIAVTGLCQLCSYFITTKASPYVFFFLNALSLFVQTEFILGYGSFHIGMTIRDLRSVEDTSSNFYVCPHRCITISIVALSVWGVIGFTAFVASFCVSLDQPFFYKLFSGLCGRAPLIVSILSSLLFQELMDHILKHICRNEPAIAAALI